MKAFLFQMIFPMILMVWSLRMWPIRAEIDFYESISVLKEKFESTEFHPKGQAFPKIRGPERLDSKIGIIGGGPAGIDMAYQLKQKGYMNVTILEKSPRVGGKAETFFYRHSEIPLSVVLWGQDYQNTLVPRLKKFGLFKDHFCPMPQLYTWPTNNDSLVAFNTFDDQTKNKESTLKALMGYTNLHRELFGNYNNDFGLMQRPDQETLTKIGEGSFHDFLKANDLLALEFVIKLIMTASGYGTLREIPAIYGLIWARPNLLFDAVTMRGGIRTLKFKSIAEVFPKMVEQEKLNVLYNFNVIQVSKGDKLNYRVQSWKDQSLEFDFLIWATGNPADYLKVTKNSDLPALKVQHILEAYQTTHASSSIIDVTNQSKASPMQLYQQNFNVDYNLSHKVVIDFDFYALGLQLSYEDFLNGQFYYKDQIPATKKSTILTFQYSSISQPEPSLKEVRESLVQHYQRFGADQIDILYTRMFEWFPRWSSYHTSLGYHWDMYEHQGEANLWFIGGGLSFESLHNVIGYNNLLLENKE